MAGRRRTPATLTSPSKYKGADGYWHARITMGVKLDGRLDRKHVKRATKASLDLAVRELERSRDTGQYVWTAADPTMAVWLDHWLEAILPLSARWKTLSTYRSQARVHIKPALGHLRLSEVQPEILEQFYAQMLRAGRSAVLVHAVHRVIRASLSEALRRQRIMSNPATVARPPRVSTVEVEPLTTAECRSLLAAARCGRNAARWSVAVSLGLRQGEALGLRWEDVNLEHGTLRVRRAVQRWTYEHGCSSDTRAVRPTCGHLRGAECPERRDGGLRLVEPKTKSSRRTLVLPAPLVQELRTHRASQVRERLEAGSAWTGCLDLVFATEVGGLIVACHGHGTAVGGFLPGSWDHLFCQLWDHLARLAGRSSSCSLTAHVMTVDVEVSADGIQGGRCGRGA